MPRSQESLSIQMDSGVSNYAGEHKKMTALHEAVLHRLETDLEEIDDNLGRVPAVHLSSQGVELISDTLRASLEHSFENGSLGPQRRGEPLFDYEAHASLCRRMVTEDAACLMASLLNDDADPKTYTASRYTGLKTIHDAARSIITVARKQMRGEVLDPLALQETAVWKSRKRSWRAVARSAAEKRLGVLDRLADARNDTDLETSKIKRESTGPYSCDLAYNVASAELRKLFVRGHEMIAASLDSASLSFEEVMTSTGWEGEVRRTILEVASRSLMLWQYGGYLIASAAAPARDNTSITMDTMFAERPDLWNRLAYLQSGSHRSGPSLCAGQPGSKGC